MKAARFAWLRALGWASVAIVAGVLGAMLAVACGDDKRPRQTTWADPWGWK